MTDTAPPETTKSMRSSEFRYIPCDSMSLGFSDNGVKLILGVEEMDGSTLDLVGVHMTHKTATILLGALSQAFEHYKKETGIDIPVPKFNKDD
jgi:hypothetical protein